VIIISPRVPPAAELALPDGLDPPAGLLAPLEQAAIIIVHSVAPESATNIGFKTLLPYLCRSASSPWA
jgi:hypothetical protein